jgi:hypothetical protein
LPPILTLTNIYLFACRYFVFVDAERFRDISKQLGVGLSRAAFYSAENSYGNADFFG